MERKEPSLGMLARLAASSEIRDRAFAAGALGLLHARFGEEASAVYERLRETARAQHRGVRAQIREKTLDGRAFLAELTAAPCDLRDHLAEEILDIAYPPLTLAAPASELRLDSPSGFSEILFMLERAQLGPGSTFVDLGSGAGKVVLLVALLTGAHAYGIEIEPQLVCRARAAARALELSNAEFIAGDMCSVSLPAADVYYLFIPSTRAADVPQRLAAFAAQRRIRLFSQRLERARTPWLRKAERGSYWLEMYEGSPETLRSAD